MSDKIRVGKGPFGRGVFIVTKIDKGEFILKLTGPIISSKEVLAKCDRECDALQVADDGYVDLIDPGRLVNHSCNPNTGIKDDSNLIALRDIEPGEEIFYDYSTTMDEEKWTMECRCEDSNCRKIVKDFWHLSEETQKKYMELGIVLGFIAKEY